MGLLRILLAICVFCSHSQPLGNLRWLGGDLAVELFFVISGFYMQLVLTTKYTKAKLGNAWQSQFYKARYFRLLPIYLIGCLLGIVAALLRPHLVPFTIWQSIWGLPATAGNLLFKAFFCFTNATLLFQDATTFLAVHNGQVHWSENFKNSALPIPQGLVIPQAWSLGIELSFYLIAPYLLRLRSRWLILAASCTLAIKVSLLQALHLGDPWTYRFFPFEVGYFLLGALAFRYKGLLDHLVPARIEKLCVYPLVIGFAVIRVPVYPATLAYPIALALILPFVFRMTAELKADRLIGELSYPFYIFHLLALMAGRGLSLHWQHWSEQSAAWVGLGFASVLSMIGLGLEVKFIEPWRARFAERRIDPVSRSPVTLEDLRGQPKSLLG